MERHLSLYQVKTHSQFKKVQQPILSSLLYELWEATLKRSMQDLNTLRCSTILFELLNKNFSQNKLIIVEKPRKIAHIDKICVKPFFYFRIS